MSANAWQTCLRSSDKAKRKLRLTMLVYHKKQCQKWLNYNVEGLTQWKTVQLVYIISLLSVWGQYSQYLVNVAQLTNWLYCYYSISVSVLFTESTRRQICCTWWSKWFWSWFIVPLRRTRRSFFTRPLWCFSVKHPREKQPFLHIVKSVSVSCSSKPCKLIIHHCALTLWA